MNRLTSSHTDKVTHTPAYKETSVQMKVLAGAGRESAAARTNFAIRPSARRRAGVEVERKWKRADYRQPGNGLVQIETR